jgi:hypothetical protein
MLAGYRPLPAIRYIRTASNVRQMILPPFNPPKYDELRAWWRLYPADDVRRLILEVQSQRYFLSELRIVAEACRNATVNNRPLSDRVRELN